VRGVVFDLDGTLYEQRVIRALMLRDLLVYVLCKPAHWRVPLLLAHFRRLRERLADQRALLSVNQFEPVARAWKLPRDAVAGLVEEWMQRRPLAYLSRARRRGVCELFADLQTRGIRIGVLSDYPIGDKLAALGLRADAVCSSVEQEVDRLKPDPAGLKLVIARLGIKPEQCMVIGDRESRDGVSARMVGAAFRLCSTADFFERLREELGAIEPRRAT
jgi:HAD superfamily hydrolase (TIGR01549 family)